VSVGGEDGFSHGLRALRASVTSGTDPPSLGDAITMVDELHPRHEQ